MREAACALALALLLGCAAPEEEEEGVSKPPIAPTQGLAPPRPVSDLEELRSYAIAQNPDIHAANRATLAALARARQAGLFPNPVLTYSFSDLHPGHGAGEASTAKHLLGVSETIPLGPRISAAQREAEEDAELARTRIELARRELIARMDEELARYLGARERSKLASEQLARLEEFEAKERMRVDAGTGLEADFASAKVEAEKGRLEVESARRAVASSEEVLRALVGKDVAWSKLDAKLPEKAPPLDAETFAERARSQSPSVVALEQQVRTARATLERVRAERFPDLAFAIAGGYSGDAKEPVIEGGIAIPIPLFNRNQHAVVAALRDVERAERSVAGEQIQVTIASAQAGRDYETARTRAEAFATKIVPAAQDALRRTLEAFGLGKPGISAHEALSAQRALVDVERELVDARVELALAIARIERIAGGPAPFRK